VTTTGTISPSAIAAPPTPTPDVHARGTVLQRNLDALSGRGIDLLALVSESARANPVGAPTARPSTQTVLSLSPTPADPMKPLVIDGVLPLERTLALYRASPPQPDGFSRRFILVHDDAASLVSAIEHTEVSAMLADPRVLCFFGEDAPLRLRAWLLEPTQQHTSLPAQAVSAAATTPSTRLQPALNEATAAQTGLHESLRTRVLGGFAGKDKRYWAARFTSGQPLRLLIPISRYSTFVRHSASDLAAALTRAGHAAEILTEPDSHSRLTTPAYLNAFDTFKPDLVVLINYTRKHMAQAVPAGVPVVCWVQDRMAHLFDPGAGASQGELDFLFGHLHPDLFTHFNYPRTNRAFAFVPACAHRFTPPASTSMGHRTEVGYVSHQSETPERFHARMKPMFASSAPVAAALDPLFAAAARWMDAAEANPDVPQRDRKSLVNEALAGAGVKSPDERLVLTVFGNYLVPLIERMARHRTLTWVAEVCDSLGLQLRLFGRGWENHPALARYAAGELPHDDRALPDTYHRCLAHLHLSMNTNAHQRVYECALSGGLMLRRGPTPDAELAKIAMMRAAAANPPIGTTPEGLPIYQCSDADGLNPARYFAARYVPPQLGESGEHAGKPVFRKPLTDAVRKGVLEDWPAFPINAMPDFGFPDATETLFRTRAELEAMLARAINDPAWREATIAAHRAATLRHCTYDRLAADLLAMVGAGLNSPTPTGSNAR
jgi:hypothetical protein